MAQEYRRPTELPDSTVTAPIVRSQLEAYREIGPKLTDAEQQNLRKWWMPRLLGVHNAPRGLPRLWISETNVKAFVRDCLATPGLSDAEKEKVRSIGREWIKDDEAILERAFTALTEGRTLPDIDAERSQRARTAATALAAFPPLEWMDTQRQQQSNKQPAPRTEPLTDADIEEFGRPHDMRPASYLADDPEAQLRELGLPLAPSNSDAERVMSLLRLDDAGKQVMQTIVSDARDTWQAQVSPAVEAARPPAPSPMMSMNMEQYRAYLAERRRLELLRRQAWEAARSADDRFFESLIAVASSDRDRAVISILQASRRSRQLEAMHRRWSPMTSGGVTVVDVASAVLDAPLSAAGRDAAAVTAAPGIRAWMDAMGGYLAACIALQDSQSVREESRSFSTGDEASERRMAETQQAFEAAQAKVDEAASRCQALADDLDAAVVGALSEKDRVRWESSQKALRKPECYRDLRGLWRAVDAAIDAAPAESRAALSAEIAPVVDGLLDRNARLGALLETLPPARHGNPALWVLGYDEELAGAEIAVLLPPASAAAFKHQQSHPLRTVLKRLEGVRSDEISAPK